MIDEEFIYGIPEDVNKRVEEIREAGIEYLILSFNPGSELKALSLFGERVLPNF